jgi:hypothetical protein
MISMSTISPIVIFVCRCIPHDSADRARREALKKASADSEMEIGPYNKNRRYRTKRTTKVRKIATPIRISLFSLSLVVMETHAAGRSSHISRPS